MRLAAIASLCTVLAACSTVPAEFSAPAELAFADTGAATGMPGSILAIDGKALPGRPSSAQVPAGRRTISFWCPNTVTLDTPPQVTGQFTSGTSYVLSCSANSEAVISRR